MSPVEAKIASGKYWPEVKRAAREFWKLDMEEWSRIYDIRCHLWKTLGDKIFHLNALSDGDADCIPGLDEVATEMKHMFPSLAAEADLVQYLYELMQQERAPKPRICDYYGRAVELVVPDEEGDAIAVSFEFGCNVF